jgi:hypothetical protein
VEVKVGYEEFISWFSLRDFAGCSVDRVDPKGHYELSNMQVITIGENTRRAQLTFSSEGGTCSGCKERKPLEDFAGCAATKNGKQPVCKLCNRARAKAWRLKRKLAKEHNTE